MKCADAQGAKAFCPVRWKALQKWINSTKHVSGDCASYFPLAMGCDGGGEGGEGREGGRG